MKLDLIYDDQLIEGKYTMNSGVTSKVWNGGENPQKWTKKGKRKAYPTAMGNPRAEYMNRLNINLSSPKTIKQIDPWMDEWIDVGEKGTRKEQERDKKGKETRSTKQTSKEGKQARKHKKAKKMAVLVLGLVLVLFSNLISESDIQVPKTIEEDDGRLFIIIHKVNYIVNVIYYFNYFNSSKRSPIQSGLAFKKLPHHH